MPSSDRRTLLRTAGVGGVALPATFAAPAVASGREAEIAWVFGGIRGERNVVWLTAARQHPRPTPPRRTAGSSARSRWRPVDGSGPSRGADRTAATTLTTER